MDFHIDFLCLGYSHQIFYKYFWGGKNYMWKLGPTVCITNLFPGDLSDGVTVSIIFWLEIPRSNVSLPSPLWPSFFIDAASFTGEFILEEKILNTSLLGF